MKLTQREKNTTLALTGTGPNDESYMEEEVVCMFCACLFHHQVKPPEFTIPTLLHMQAHPFDCFPERWYIITLSAPK